MITIHSNTKRAEKKAERMVKDMNRLLPEIGSFAGKRMAFLAMQYTFPMAQGKPWPVDALQGRIEEDIQRAYPSRTSPNWFVPAYALIEDAYGKKKADTFWLAYKSAEVGTGKIDSQESLDIMRADEIFNSARKVPRRTNETKHAELKKKSFGLFGKAWRLNPMTRPQAMVNDANQATLIRKKRSVAGLAKAAWRAASNMLGGTQNYSQSENANNRFVWPKEASKVIRGKSGLGSGSVTNTFGKTVATVTNHLSYAAYAFPDHMKSLAVDYARKSIRIYMETRFRHSTKSIATMKEAA